MEVTGAWVQIPGRKPPPKQRWPGTLQRDQGENSEFLRITATFFFSFFLEMWVFLSLRTMHGGGSAPSCCAFTHRVAFEDGSGPRV